MIDGYKNYIFAAIFVAAGVADYFFPALGIQVAGIDTPPEFITAGIAWGLGRNALKKLEPTKEEGS